MATQVEELDGDTVRLKVDVPAHDVHHAVEHATSDLAQSVKIPASGRARCRRRSDPAARQGADHGRGGRQPHRRLVLERRRAGAHPAGRAAAVRLRAADRRRRDWQFTATVPVQPKVDVVDWTELEVGKPEAEVPEELVARSSRRCASRSPSSSRRRPAGEGGRHARRRHRLARGRGAARHGRRARRRPARRGGRGGARRRLGGRDEERRVRACGRVDLERRDHGQGDQREGAARTRRRARALRERVRHARRAARRHRAAAARGRRRRDRERLPRQRRRRAGRGLEGGAGGPTRRVAHPRAADGVHPLARAPRDRARDLPAADRPLGRGADQLDAARGRALGRARAGARGRRRQARASRSPTTR